MKNTRWLILAGAIILLPLCVSATTVELTADKDVVWIGQKIEIMLKLHSEEKITGQLTVTNLDEKRQEKTLFQSISPGCTCRADTRAIGDVTDTSTFTPLKLGNYQVRAYFDGVEKTLNFTVKSKLQEEMTTTTTTSPVDDESGGYIKLDGYNLDKCQTTILGGMNILNIDIGYDVEGVWGPTPNSYVLFRCDGGDKHPVDRILLKGGSNIGENQSVTGSYRLMVKCGRNTLIDDLAKCDKVEIYLDTKGVVRQEQPTEQTTTSTTIAPTTTTLQDLMTTTTVESIPSTTIVRENESVTDSEPNSEQNPSIFDGCPCDWAPALIGGIFLFIALVDAVYKYLGGGKKTKGTSLGGEK